MTAIKIYTVPEDILSHINVLPKLNFCDKTVNEIFSLAHNLGQLYWYKILKLVHSQSEFKPGENAFDNLCQQKQTLCPLIAQIAPSYKTHRNRA